VGAVETRRVAFVFEGGGHVGSPVEEDLRGIRHGIALDALGLLAGLRRAGDLDRVVLVTDRAVLAAAVPAGVEVESSQGTGAFHFGRSLGTLLRRHRADLALVMGGAAAPLYGEEDFRRFLQLAAGPGATVVQNNPQSPDVLAFRPAAFAADLGLPDRDNALGYALSEAGFRRVLVENSARVNFDVDTPTDAALLADEPGIGPLTARACAGVPWMEGLRRRLATVADLLAAEGSELALFGRVGPPVTGYLNAHLHCRLRVFSEERGMRALGREAAGLVVSFVGRCLDALGPHTFFDLLRGCCDAALLDTRVLMAHWHRPLSDADRFHSDIGAAAAIADERLRAFTEAAFHSAVPLVLGGHNLVYGGLWLLADRALRRLRPPGA
jgi:CTP:molybdopterin cytidylyltransferase MocA